MKLRDAMFFFGMGSGETNSKICFLMSIMKYK